jgi:hypothetical protein
MELVLFIAFWLWVFSLYSDGTNADPDKAYGEVDSDGDFGN